MTRDWWAPLTGAAFLVVGILAFAIGGEPPDAGNSAEEIVSHYVDNQDSVIFGAVLATLASALLVFFGATLSAALRAADRGPGILSAAVLVGASVMAIGLAIDSTILFALAETADDIEPASVQTLQALYDNDFLPIAMGTLIFLISSGLGVIRTGVLPKWLGWLAIVLAVIALTPLGFIAFIGSAIWILIASIMLTMRARSTPPTATPPAATPPATA